MEIKKYKNMFQRLIQETDLTGECYMCVCAGGGGARDHQAGGERGSGLLGETPSPPLRAAAGGSGPQPRQGQAHPEAGQLQRHHPGGPR